MPVLIPTAKDQVSEQARMIREGLQVHDAECCTAEAPCTLRRGMQIVLDRLNGQTTVLSPRVQAPAPAKRPQGSGNGFGTPKPARRTSRLATEAQQGMLRKMAEFADQRHHITDEFLAETTMAEVDKIRDWLIKKGNEVKTARAEARKAAAQATPSGVTEGMYRLANGDIYKVQKAVHGSGRLYAKKLVRGDDEWFFDIARGALSKLTVADRMTVEEAAEFGKLYGICVRCAATLTDEASIARGMGKVCAGKI